MTCYISACWGLVASKVGLSLSTHVVIVALVSAAAWTPLETKPNPL